MIRFSGTEMAVNDALKWIWVDGAATDDKVSLFAQDSSSNQSVVYSPDSGHFYEHVAAPNVTWLNANSAAAAKTFGGQDGYLAQIPNAAVNDFITSKIPGAENVWIGGRASMATPYTSDPTDTLGNSGIVGEISRN